MCNGTQILLLEIKNFERLQFERLRINLLIVILKKIWNHDFTLRKQGSSSLRVSPVIRDFKGLEVQNLDLLWFKIKRYFDKQ